MQIYTNIKPLQEIVFNTKECGMSAITKPENVSLKEQIKEVAHRVRHKCLKFALSDAANNYDYCGRKDLACMCAVVSTVLAKEYRRLKIDTKAKVVLGVFKEQHNEHCWVLCNNMMVDITATQFSDIDSDIQEVEIWTMNTRREKWKVKKVGNPGQIALGWDCQSPIPTVISQITKLD